MQSNQNPPKKKGESRISQALKEYARSQLESNNPRLNTTTQSKVIYTLPKLQTPKNQPPNKQIFSKYNFRQNNTPILHEQTKPTQYKQNTERIGHRSVNKNHSFFESKTNKTEGKKYPQRSSNTYKQPESRNLKDNYQERKSNDNSNINNNNIKRKYETTSYELPGRRKNKYENKSYQGEKYPPKYYRNNPHIFDIHPVLNSNTLVAQKICNIAIKGGKSYLEKENTNINSNNRRRNRGQMIEYEIEDNNLGHYYNNEEEIEEDSANNFNEDNAGGKKLKIVKKKIKRIKNTKRKNYKTLIS